MKNLPKFIAAIIGCELVGLLSTPVTIQAIPAWYTTLNKPSFAPPNWLFGPAWTTLYLLMGIAFYLIWIQDWKKTKVKTAGRFFLIQLFFNFLWSFLFFGLRSPLLGLIDIMVMWIFIVMTMNKFYPLSKPAFYLMVPYLLWVSFATILNFSIALLN